MDGVIMFLEVFSIIVGREKDEERVWKGTSVNLHATWSSLKDIINIFLIIPLFMCVCLNCRERKQTHQKLHLLCEASIPNNSTQ